MKKKIVKKIIWGSLGFIFLMLVVLVAHIYVMTRIKPPDEHTRVMARIDFKQKITQPDADKITTWLYRQKGIDRVLCNAKTSIAIFTYYPVKTNADAIVSNLSSQLKYSAQRYIPSSKDLQNGCPVATNSFSYKAAGVIQKLLN